MWEIRLDDARLNFDGEWLSVEDLTRMIQEKIQAGEMKFAKMASALEELKKVLENSVTIETKLVISKEAYDKLKTVGGEDDRESVRKAIQAFISRDDGSADIAASKDSPNASDPDSSGKKIPFVKCTKCKTLIEITSDQRPLEIKCPKCGATGRLKT